MPPRDSFFTVANLLSLSRLPLGALFAWTFTRTGGRWWPSLLVLALAGASDALDGWFARREQARRSGGKDQETPAGTGSWLDPICDKVFVATVLGTIWMQFRPPLTWVALTLTRELAQLPLSLVYLAIPSLHRWLRYDFRASLPGKAATVVQFLAIVALVFRSPLAHALAYASCGLGLIALGDYLRRAVELGKRRYHADHPDRSV
ncbi:MAG TPA: CDP-alcohol phosphatidyltransferase family protein [Polyangia bacterium]|jgi:cardiolipin synthase|nr:CDP-alcohol phosphatidyltransferase family protein [Polyangia bacterium]